MTTNYLRVAEAFDILDNVFAPFVMRVLREKYGGGWWTHGVLGAVHPDQRRNLPHGGGSDDLIRWLDTALCLTLIEHHWHDLFALRLGPDTRGQFRELHGIRNRVAHKGPDDIPTSPARHALDLIHGVVAPIDGFAGERVQALIAELGNGP